MQLLWGRRATTHAAAAVCVSCVAAAASHFLCCVWLHHTVHFVSFPACPPGSPPNDMAFCATAMAATTNVAGALLLLAALSTGQSFLNAHLRTLGVPAHEVCPTRAPRPACH